MDKDRNSSSAKITNQGKLRIAMRASVIWMVSVILLFYAGVIAQNFTMIAETVKRGFAWFLGF
jgi:hypothetical protein